MEQRTTQEEIERLLERAAKSRKRAETLEKRAARLQKIAMVVPTYGEEEEAVPERPELDFSYTQNRELSWLQFNNRVLDEAADPTVPLLERLNYVAIFQSNLDEFVMIRVGGLDNLSRLPNQLPDTKSDQTPAEQLEDVRDVMPALSERAERVFNALEAELANHGVVRVDAATYTDADRAYLEGYFEDHIAPIVSAFVIDPRHPFPKLRNGRLEVLATLSDGEDQLLGTIEIPKSVRRVVKLPSEDGTLRYTLAEDVVREWCASLFPTLTTEGSCVVRVTRNADINPDLEGRDTDADFKVLMKDMLKKRQRLAPVRLEIQGTLPDDLVDYLLAELDLPAEALSVLSMPLDLSYVRQIMNDSPSQDLLFKPFEPQPSAAVSPGATMRENVVAGDILLAFPYESIDPLLRLLRECATDDECISIKVTLYRVAKRSRLCEALIAAAEAGKDVTVLLELRARFDESNNIAWAERLEAAGCTVIYGAKDYKVHSKVCQVTYHTADGIRRIACLGTGNFNEETARLYSDFLLLTAEYSINEDVASFFKNLSVSRIDGAYLRLGVAPVSLKPLIMDGLDREIARAKAGEPARAVMKMNSLTDRDVIDKIAAATQAGVKVTLVVRGICCILPGVEGKTEGLVVKSIVGRLLEHARVYAFGQDFDLVYLSSADMMTRNTTHRVEIAFPVIDPACRAKVLSYMDLQLKDNVKVRTLTPQGTWEKVEPQGDRVNVQEALITAATVAAQQTRPMAPVAQAPKSETTLPDAEEMDRMLAQASLDIVELSDIEETDIIFETGTFSAPDVEYLVSEPDELSYLNSKGRIAGWASLLKLANVCLFHGPSAVRAKARQNCEKDAKKASKEAKRALLQESREIQRAQKDQEAAVRRREGR